MKSERWTKHKVDPVKINWAHNHWSIRCRLDWKEASVFEFPEEICLNGGIIAYSIGDAMSVLEEIKMEEAKKKANNDD